MGIEELIKPVAEIQEEESYSMIVYGEPKVGKTRLASTMGEKYRTLLIDTESGTKSIDRDIPHLDAIRLDRSYPQLLEIWDYLSKGETGYEAVIIDNLRDLEDKIMRHTIHEFNAVKRPYGDSPGQSDYGRTMDLLTRAIKAFRDLPMHVIFVTWEKLQQDDDVGSKLVPAIVGKSLPEEIIGYIDICGRMYKQQTDDGLKTKILFTSIPHIAAGDRSGKLPDVMENPTMPKIFEYLEGAVKKDGRG